MPNTKTPMGKKYFTFVKQRNKTSKCTFILHKFVEYLQKSGLVGWDVVIRFGRFPVQIPLGARFETTGDLQVEYVKTQ